MTEKVNTIAETRVSLWSTVMSPELGRLTWSTVVEDLATLMALDEKLLADSGYHELGDQGTAFSTDSGIDDGLVRTWTGTETASSPLTTPRWCAPSWRQAAL